MEIKRSLTNLVVKKDLMLNRKQLKSDFLFLFNKGYKGSEAVFMNRLICTAIAPGLANEPAFGVKPNLKAYFNDKRINPGRLASHIRIIKELAAEDPFFAVTVPVLACQTTEVLHILQTKFVPQGMSSPYADLADEISNLPRPESAGAVVPAYIQGVRVLAAAKWLGAQAQELKNTLLGVKYDVLGDEVLISLELKISKEIAQHLTSTPWSAIRNMDLYPLISAWVLSYWGERNRGKPLLNSFPISAIARTLPPDHGVVENRRIDSYGVSISPKGEPQYLPQEINNTERYEDLYAQAGAQNDNSFSLVPWGGALENIKRLPANIPVLIDWQNLKFAYSNTSGILEVLDLTRNIKCDAAHAQVLLNDFVDFKLLARVFGLAQAAGASISALSYYKPEDLDAANNHRDTVEPIPADRVPSAESIAEYVAKIARIYKVYTGQTDIRYTDMLSDGWPLFRPVLRAFEEIYAKALSNLDAIYTRYSVSYVTATLGWLSLFVNYGRSYAETVASANQLTSAAVMQGVDPNWKMPSVPLLSDKIGLLPHQNKVRNLLKDSPDLAILPIQAGGGKSPLALIDILLEIKANRNNPYLILCPGHLVAQYVKEIVYFTSGKLNVIPITSYAVRTSGYKRLEAIFKAAPRNTVVVCNYDTLRFRATSMVYGTSPTVVFPVIEFLRQFHFGYVMLDESHSVKNQSARTRATLALIADIPKKRLASGTMAHDSPTDLALQVSMLDPTLFGSREKFNEVYGEDVKGDRVITWKPGAAQDIMRKIKSRVVVAGAMRKEWAALLPIPHEKFLRVDLSPAQLAVYQSLLERTLDEIREAAKTNPMLARFLHDDGVEGAEGAEVESEADEEDMSEALEQMLRPYLARLEQFVTAPTRDPLGDKLLTGDERMSPKVRMIAQRIEEHVKSGIPGKVLVFTSYTDSAEEIYESMPAELKAQGILYRAADKVEAGAQFENDPSKTWMVGVEFSMNTGLNFQFVSRLIRVEAVWNPGTLEQGNSRVNRPELKKADRRDSIYYDWIVANQTIDITKVSRLISKIIAIAKFENADEGTYQALPDVEVIKMTLSSIRDRNSWDSSLMDYFSAYKDYKQVMSDDYAIYREKHGEVKLEAIESAPTPSDAMLLKRVPYVPGLELYGAAELGLVRLDEYLRMESQDEDEDALEPTEGEDEADTGNKNAELKAALRGKMVHTEYGDGVIIGLALSSRRVAVRLESGYVMRTRLANTFIVTREETSTKDIRNQLLKSVGEMPIATPVDVPGALFKPAPMTKKELREQQQREELRKAKEQKKQKPAKAMSAELFFSVSNGFLGLTYMGEDENVGLALQAVGFRATQPFYFAEVKTARALVKQFDLWREAGFTLDKKLASDISQAFRNLHKVMDTKALTNRISYQFSVASRLANFFRAQAKPNNDSAVIKPYPLIEDGKAYIVLPYRGQSGTIEAIKYKAPTIRWVKSSASLIYFCETAEKAQDVLQLVIRNGIELPNVKELEAEYKKLRRVKFRAEDDLDHMEV